MRKHNFFKLPFLAVICVTGCTSIEKNPQSTLTDLNNALELNKVFNPEDDIRDYSVFTPRNHNTTLNDYVEQIIMDFQLNGPLSKPIAIASFVEFDETLSKTNSLGNQLAEAFLIEMSQAGYPVADITASDRILTNSNGSFAFNRLEEEIENFCCALSGNLIYQSNGVRVNTKVFDIQTKRVLAASSLVIPYFVVEHLGHPQIR